MTGRLGLGGTTRGTGRSSRSGSTASALLAPVELRNSASGVGLTVEEIEPDGAFVNLWATAP